MRGQTSLPVVGVALVVLITATVSVVTVADDQLHASRTESLERSDAVGLSESLVDARSPLTQRANVISHGQLGTLNAQALVDRHGLDSGNGVRVQIGNRVLVDHGPTGEGTTIRRIVLVERPTRRTIEPRFRARSGVTLPRRSPNVTLHLAPGGNRTVERVRANGRVVLMNPDGLRGQFTVSLSRQRTARLRFEGNGSLQQGDLEVTYYPARTRKAMLAISVQGAGNA